MIIPFSTVTTLVSFDKYSNTPASDGVNVAFKSTMSSTFKSYELLTLISVWFLETVTITYAIDPTYLSVPANSTVIFATPPPTAWKLPSLSTVTTLVSLLV